MEKTFIPTVKIDGKTVEDNPALKWLDVLSVELHTAPDYSQATLRYLYGNMGLKTYEYVPPLNLSESSVEIYIEKKLVFSGIVVTPKDIPHGLRKNADAEVLSGSTIFSCWGWDLILDRIRVTGSYVVPENFVNIAIPFNGGTAGGMEKNRMADKAEGQNSFCFDNAWEVEPQLWSVYDIIEYLLDRFATDQDWKITGQPEVIAALKTNHAQLDPDGRSVRECINELLSVSSGWSWFCSLDDSDPDNLAPTINVFSVSDVDLKFGEQVMVPQNTNIFSLKESVPDQRSMSNVTLQTCAQSSYSSIRVYSEPIRVMTTLKLESFEEGWYDDEKTAYDAASDEARKDDRFDRVYQSFSSDLEQDYEQKGIRVVYDPETALVTFDKESPMAYKYVNFDRTLPVLKDETDKKNYRKPILFMKYSGNYIIADKALSSIKIGLDLYDNGPGINLKCPYNHAAANGDFTGTSAFSPVYDYSEALVTASFYSQEPISFTSAGVEKKIPWTKEIYIPGFHLWIGRNGTMLSPTEKLTEDKIYRDDREQLKRLTVMAGAWYGRQRNIVNVSLQHLFAFNELGYIMTDVYSGGSFTSAGTPITQINYDFMAQSMTLATEFDNIDFSNIAAGLRNKKVTAISRRIARIEEQLQQIPLRPANDNTGGSYTGYFKVIQTAANKIKIVDGMDNEAANCFSGYINQLKKDIPATELTITGNCIIYLELVASGVPVYGFTATFKTGTALPNFANRVENVLISRVSFVDGSVTNFSQENVPNHIIVWGAC